MMCLHKHGYFLQSGPELHGPTGSQMDRIELFKAYIHTQVSEDISQLTIVDVDIIFSCNELISSTVHNYEISVHNYELCPQL